MELKFVKASNDQERSHFMFDDDVIIGRIYINSYNTRSVTGSWVPGADLEFDGGGPTPSCQFYDEYVTKKTPTINDMCKFFYRTSIFSDMGFGAYSPQQEQWLENLFNYLELSKEFDLELEDYYPGVFQDIQFGIMYTNYGLYTVERKMDNRGGVTKINEYPRYRPLDTEMGNGTYGMIPKSIEVTGFGPVTIDAINKLFGHTV